MSRRSRANREENRTPTNHSEPAHRGGHVGEGGRAANGLLVSVGHVGVIFYNNHSN